MRQGGAILCRNSVKSGEEVDITKFPWLPFCLVSGFGENGQSQVQAGLLYFVLVFGAACMLGPIRILWAVPAFGTRVAELIEMPIMFVVITIAAYWTVRHLAVPPIPSKRLSMGLIALGLVLIAEFTVVLRLLGLSIEDYFASRDPVSGRVYVVMLGVFAIVPLLVARR